MNENKETEETLIKGFENEQESTSEIETVDENNGTPANEATGENTTENTSESADEKESETVTENGSEGGSGEEKVSHRAKDDKKKESIVKRAKQYIKDAKTDNRKKKNLIIALLSIVILIILILGVVIGINVYNASQKNTRADGFTNPAATGTYNPTPTDSDSVCHLKGDAQTELKAIPDGVSYGIVTKTFYGPTSSEYGPAQHDDETGVGYCYQQSPAGAVLAGSNIVLYAYAGLSDGLNKHSFKTDGTPKKLSNTGVLQFDITGFNLTSYTSTSATMELSANMVDKNYEASVVAITMILHWVDGDWKVDFTQSDSTSDSLLGYPRKLGYTQTALEDFIIWPDAKIGDQAFDNYNMSDHEEESSSSGK